jgi:glycosyltransferase involved in cell wall biosynthesis
MEISVCILLRRTFPSEYSTAFNEYARVLASKGIDVTIVCAKKYCSEEEDMEVTENGIRIIREEASLEGAVSLEPTMFAIRAFRSLSTYLKKTGKNIDILHWLSFPHNGLFVYPPPFLQKPSSYLLDIRATAVSNKINEMISKYIIKLQARLHSNVAVINNQVAEKLFNGTEGLYNIPIGVSMDRFQPGRNKKLRREIGLKASNTVLTYVGNLHKSRRLDILIDAFYYANQKSKDIKLMIVGGGKGKKELIEYVKSLGLEKDVFFSGSVPFEEVPHFLKASDVGVSYIHDIPQYNKQPPIKTLEYLSAGLPVVATNTKGNTGFVQDNKNGLIAEDDRHSIKNSILRIVKNDELKNKLSKNARNSIKQYDYEKIVEKDLIPIYEEISA